MSLSRGSEATTTQQQAAAKSNDNKLIFTKMSLDFAKLELWKPQPMITFVVGSAEGRETFIVHKELAVSSSPFFNAAFNGKFLEGITQTMLLDDVDPRIFGLLIHWLYTHRVMQPAHNEELFRALGGPLLTYAKLWSLGSRCLMPALQNHLMTKLATGMRFENDVAKRRAFINYAAREHGEKQLRFLAVQAVAYFVGLNEVKGYVAELPGDVVADIMVVLMEEVARGNARALGRLAFRPCATYFVQEPKV